MKINYPSVLVLLLCATLASGRLLQAETTTNSRCSISELLELQTKVHNYSIIWDVKRTIPASRWESQQRLRSLAEVRKVRWSEMSKEEQLRHAEKVKEAELIATHPRTISFSINTLVGGPQSIYAVQHWSSNNNIYKYYFSPEKGVRVDEGNKHVEPLPIDSPAYRTVMEGLLRGIPILLLNNIIQRQGLGERQISILLNDASNNGDSRIEVTLTSDNHIASILTRDYKGVKRAFTRVSERNSHNELFPTQTITQIFDPAGDLVFEDVFSLKELNNVASMPAKTFMWPMADGYTILNDGYGNNLNILTDSIAR